MLNFNSNSVEVEVEMTTLLKLNLGCGENHMQRYFNKEITGVQIGQAFKNFNNVVKEIKIVLKVVK
jgi:hypothetical protein